MHAESLQSCLTLCHPMDCSPPGSSVHWILKARTLEWVAMPSPPGCLSNPGINSKSPGLATGFFTTSTTWEVLARKRQKQICVFRNNNLAAAKKIARRKKKGRRVQKTSQKTIIICSSKKYEQIKHSNVNITLELSEGGGKNLRFFGCL